MRDSALTRKWLTATTLALAAALALLVYLAISGTYPTQASTPNPGTQINENSAPGTSLGHPVGISPAGLAATYSLSGPDAGSFRIDPSTGEMSLAEGVSPDFETKSRYDVTVTVSAGVVITVNNLNEPGQVALSNDSPSAGDTITATLSDPDGGLTGASWAWSRGEDGDWDPITRRQQRLLHRPGRRHRTPAPGGGLLRRRPRDRQPSQRSHRQPGPERPAGL